MLGKYMRQKYDNLRDLACLVLVDHIIIMYIQWNEIHQKFLIVLVGQIGEKNRIWDLVSESLNQFRVHWHAHVHVCYVTIVGVT